MSSKGHQTNDQELVTDQMERSERSMEKLAYMPKDINISKPFKKTDVTS